MRKLYKSKDSRAFSGIFGGLGEWMEVSPGVLRVGYIVLALITMIWPAVLLYIVMHFLIPEKQK